MVAWRGAGLPEVGCLPGVRRPAGVGGAWRGLGPGRRAPSAPAAAAMWCLHCNSERTQSLLELELDSG